MIGNGKVFRNVNYVTRIFPIIFPLKLHFYTNPAGKVHGVNMGPNWVLSSPDGPHESCYQGRYKYSVLWHSIDLP